MNSVDLDITGEIDVPMLIELKRIGIGSATLHITGANHETCLTQTIRKGESLRVLTKVNVFNANQA